MSGMRDQREKSKRIVRCLIEIKGTTQPPLPQAAA